MYVCMYVCIDFIFRDKLHVRSDGLLHSLAG